MQDDGISNKKIGIIGLGLIGGSIAKALCLRAKIKDIIAVDLNEQSILAAYNEGIISSYSNEIISLKECDIVFLCVPPGIIPSILDELASFYKGIITDVGSTKGKICDYVNNAHTGIRFVGAHPMAGSERVGYEASNENLFENAPYIFCRTEDSQNDDIDTVKKLAILMGAVPIEMSPEKHDISVGLISHLPHIIAYSLVKLVSSTNDEVLKNIAAGGFRDITRIASSDPELWTDIICESGTTMTTLIEQYIEVLTRISDSLCRKDKGELHSVFQQAKVFRDDISRHSLTKGNTVQLWVEVDDKPGMIGKIAVLFGDNKINIKNINIQDNREYEGGSMRITLSGIEDAQLGAKLLEDENLNFRIVN
jgi:prephenate dehydrogenase